MCINGSDMAGTIAVIDANIVDPTTSHTIGDQFVAERGIVEDPFSFESNAWRNATTVTRLVIVRRDSADP